MIAIAETEFVKPDSQVLNRWKRMLAYAMQNSDELLVEFEYRDRKGKWSRRVVSPIRFTGGKSILGLCLSREAPRQFQIEYCRNLILRFAHEYVMPVPMVQLDSPPPISSGVISSGAISSGAISSGAISSGAISSGAISSGAINRSGLPVSPEHTGEPSFAR